MVDPEGEDVLHDRGVGGLRGDALPTAGVGFGGEMGGRGLGEDIRDAVVMDPGGVWENAGAGIEFGVGSRAGGCGDGTVEQALVQGGGHRGYVRGLKDPGPTLGAVLQDAVRTV